MNAVYEAMKTPYKRGMVINEPDVNIDCPNVFRQQDGRWGMVFVRHIPGADREGYETWLAQSNDLLHWQVTKRLLAQKAEGWDSIQVAGGLALIDPAWEGSARVATYDGKYWMSYVGGALAGYEPDPLHIGIARATEIDSENWDREKNPILRQDDPDARIFETATLYKSTIIEDDERRFGHRFLMYYNGKQKGAWVERIGLAVSDDMVHWQRDGENALIENDFTDFNICGDPQLIRFGDLWVMHYFIAHAGSAWDTFACSKDLLHWTKWNGEPLIQPSESYDKTYAHKPFVLKHHGVVYHFYCAVGDQGRGIAVATSAT